MKYWRKCLSKKPLLMYEKAIIQTISGQENVVGGHWN